MAQLKTSVTGFLTLKQQLEVLKMKPGQRKRLLKTMARGVQKSSRRRIREQRDLNGKPWKGRKKKSRKKMLRGLSKRMINFATPDKGVVTFKGSATARIATAHQEGHTEVMTKAELMKKRGGDYQKNQAATRTQAKALIGEGFKTRRENGKGWKRPSIKWITANMSMAQAGLIHRLISDEDASTNWKISVPARSFLGLSEKERFEHTQMIYQETLAKMRNNRRG